MKILITNDDGLDAEGLLSLVRSLRKIKGVRVMVVAPDRERSSVSHALTLRGPLRVKKRDQDVYTVDGTPADCVFMALSVILKTKPDLVFSGINHGANLGDDVHYSGTVAAAVEAVMGGIPAVALSQVIKKKFDCTQACRFAGRLLKFFKKHPLPPGVVLNVNVPENVKDFDYEITATGKRNYGDLVEYNVDPRGRPYYWIGGNQHGFCDIPGSDCNAVLKGKISVTPLNVNWTNQDLLLKMQGWRI